MTTEHFKKSLTMKSPKSGRMIPKLLINVLTASILSTYCTLSFAGTVSGFVAGAATSASTSEEKNPAITPITIAGSKVFYCPSFRGVTCTVDEADLPGAQEYAAKHGIRYFAGYKLNVSQVAYLVGGANAKIKSITVIPGRSGSAQAVLEWE